MAELFNPELHLTVGQLRRIGVAMDPSLVDDAYIEKSACRIEAAGPLNIDENGTLQVPVRVLFMQPLAALTLNVSLNAVIPPAPSEPSEPSTLPGEQRA